jgi:hypothetical protein
MLKLDLVQSIAFAGVILFIGYGIHRVIPSTQSINRELTLIDANKN